MGGGQEQGRQGGAEMTGSRASLPEGAPTARSSRWRLPKARGQRRRRRRPPLRERRIAGGGGESGCRRESRAYPPDSEAAPREDWREAPDSDSAQRPTWIEGVTNADLGPRLTRIQGHSAP